MPKGKKIPHGSKSLQTPGLHSKIYIATFSEKISVNKIAEKIYGDPSKNQKISSIFSDERFNILFDFRKPSLEEDRRKTYVIGRVEPFLNEIEKKVDLKEKERDKLKKYLDGPFRKATKKKYLDIDYSKEIDAYSELLGLLLAITGIEYTIRTSVLFGDTLPIPDSHKGMKEKFYEIYQNKAPEEFSMSSVPWSDDEIFDPVKDFPDELLEKFDETDLGGSREVLRKHFKFFNRLMNLFLKKLKKQSQ